MSAHCRLLAIPLAVLATACAPVLPHRYALLEADDATVLTNKCWGTKETIRYDREGVGVEIRLLKRGEGRWLMEERFDVPAGKTVKLIGNDMRVFNRKRQDLFRVDFLGMSTNGNPELPLMPIAPMVGGQQAALPTSPLHYWIFAPVKDYDVDAVLFALPPFTVNGAFVEFPTVVSKQKTEFQVVAPLQC
jgi:hypothetical protein